MNRRGFISGLGALIAAPAVVRAEILMPVRSIIKPECEWFGIDLGTQTSKTGIWVVNWGNPNPAFHPGELIARDWQYKVVPLGEHLRNFGRRA